MDANLSHDMNEALITGDVLKWARERRGLSHVELAKLVKVGANQIKDWEEEITRPPYVKAEQIANKLKIPFGYFWFSSRPSDDTPLPDLRTIDEFAHRRLSADAIDQINNVLLKQDWYRGYAEEERMDELTFVGKFSTSDDPDEVAESISETLGISPALRKSARNWTGYLSKLIAAAESRGILVIRTGVVRSSSRRGLSVADFRGFAVSDKLAPLVSINAKDSVAARIFTLIHELAHIWLGKRGISNSDGIDSQSALPLETFCNTVAVSALVPLDQFNDLWNNTKSADRIDRIAAAFKVSSVVIVRRAFETDKISRPQFLDLMREARANQKPIKRATGGNPATMMRARNSGPVTDAALKSVRLGRLSYVDASRLLGVKTGYIFKLTGKRKTVQ